MTSPSPVIIIIAKYGSESHRFPYPSPSISLIELRESISSHFSLSLTSLKLLISGKSLPTATPSNIYDFTPNVPKSANGNGEKEIKVVVIGTKEEKIIKIQSDEMKREGKIVHLNHQTNAATETSSSSLSLDLFHTSPHSLSLSSPSSLPPYSPLTPLPSSPPPSLSLHTIENYNDEYDEYCTFISNIEEGMYENYCSFIENKKKSFPTNSPQYFTYNIICEIVIHHISLHSLKSILSSSTTQLDVNLDNGIILESVSIFGDVEIMRYLVEKYGRGMYNESYEKMMEEGGGGGNPLGNQMNQLGNNILNNPFLQNLINPPNLNPNPIANANGLRNGGNPNEDDGNNVGIKLEVVGEFSYHLTLINHISDLFHFHYHHIDTTTSHSFPSHSPYSKVSLHSMNNTVVKKYYQNRKAINGGSEDRMDSPYHFFQLNTSSSYSSHYNDNSFRHRTFPPHILPPFFLFRHSPLYFSIVFNRFEMMKFILEYNGFEYFQKYINRKCENNVICNGNIKAVKERNGMKMKEKEKEQKMNHNNNSGDDNNINDDDADTDNMSNSVKLSEYNDNRLLSLIEFCGKFGRLSMVKYLMDNYIFVLNKKVSPSNDNNSYALQCPPVPVSYSSLRVGSGKKEEKSPSKSPLSLFYPNLTVELFDFPFNNFHIFNNLLLYAVENNHKLLLFYVIKMEEMIRKLSPCAEVYKDLSSFVSPSSSLSSSPSPSPPFPLPSYLFSPSTDLSTPNISPLLAPYSLLVSPPYIPSFAFGNLSNIRFANSFPGRFSSDMWFPSYYEYRVEGNRWNGNHPYRKSGRGGKGKSIPGIYLPISDHHGIPSPSLPYLFDYYHAFLRSIEYKNLPFLQYFLSSLHCSPLILNGLPIRIAAKNGWMEGLKELEMTVERQGDGNCMRGWSHYERNEENNNTNNDDIKIKGNKWWLTAERKGLWRHHDNSLHHSLYDGQRTLKEWKWVHSAHPLAPHPHHKAFSASFCSLQQQFIHSSSFSPMESTCDFFWKNHYFLYLLRLLINDHDGISTVKPSLGAIYHSLEDSLYNIIDYPPSVIPPSFALIPVIPRSSLINSPLPPSAPYDQPLFPFANEMLHQGQIEEWHLYHSYLYDLPSTSLWEAVQSLQIHMIDYLLSQFIPFPSLTLIEDDESHTPSQDNYFTLLHPIQQYLLMFLQWKREMITTKSNNIARALTGIREDIMKMEGENANAASSSPSPSLSSSTVSSPTDYVDDHSYYLFPLSLSRIISSYLTGSDGLRHRDIQQYSDSLFSPLGPRWRTFYCQLTMGLLYSDAKDAYHKCYLGLEEGWKAREAEGKMRAEERRARNQNGAKNEWEGFMMYQQEENTNNSSNPNDNPMDREPSPSHDSDVPPPHHFYSPQEERDIRRYLLERFLFFDNLFQFTTMDSMELQKIHWEDKTQYEVEENNGESKKDKLEDFPADYSPSASSAEFSFSHHTFRSWQRDFDHKRKLKEMAIHKEKIRQKEEEIQRIREEKERKERSPQEEKKSFATYQSIIDGQLEHFRNQIANAQGFGGIPRNNNPIPAPIPIPILNTNASSSSSVPSSSPNHIDSATEERTHNPIDEMEEGDENTDHGNANGNEEEEERSAKKSEENEEED